jgi:hypothetical protein
MTTRIARIFARRMVFLGRTFSGHHYDYSMLQQEFPPEEIGLEISMSFPSWSNACFGGLLVGLRGVYRMNVIVGNNACQAPWVACQPSVLTVSGV